MAKSNFGGGAYTLRSLPLAAQTCINLYLEPREDAPGEYAFYGTPGKVVRATLGTSGGHRGSLVAGNHLYCVVGSGVYKVTSAFASTLLGTLPSASGKVQMAQNGQQLVIAHRDGWHVVTLSTGAMAAVANSPAMSDVSFIDNYGVGAAANGTYVWSNLADFSTVGALSFASAEGHPDRILRTISDHRELWLFGEVSIEVAVVSGDPDLPFTRTAFIEQGILAPHSAAKEDNSVFWLGRNESGQGVVYRAEGYVPTRVSTFAIEQAIQNYASPEDAVAFTYQQDGHHYYVLSFAEATWVYDINVGLWHQRSWRDTTTGEVRRDRAHTHVFFSGQHLVGDWEDGRLYALDMSTFTDDGDPIYRERVWAQIENENGWMTFHKGELIAEMGVGQSGAVSADATDPKVWLSWSNDGGRTWSSELDRSLGAIGEFRSRAVWRRLGKSRSRYFRLRTSAPVRLAFRSFTLEMS